VDDDNKICIKNVVSLIFDILRQANVLARLLCCTFGHVLVILEERHLSGPSLTWYNVPMKEILESKILCFCALIVFFFWG
jgi:hypothetical protein